MSDTYISQWGTESGGKFDANEETVKIFDSDDYDQDTYSHSSSRIAGSPKHSQKHVVFRSPPQDDLLPDQDLDSPNMSYDFEDGTGANWVLSAQTSMGTPGYKRASTKRQ